MEWTTIILIALAIIAGLWVLGFLFQFFIVGMFIRTFNKTSDKMFKDFDKKF